MKKFMVIAIVAALLLSCTACVDTPQDDFDTNFFVDEDKNDKSDVSEAIISSYPVTITVDCYINLIFSKYDVDVYVDGELLGNHDHGATRTYTTELAEGTHSIVFEKEDEATVDGQDSFSISAPTDITYKISCYNDQVVVEQISFLEKNKYESNDESNTANDVSQSEDTGTTASVTTTTTKNHQIIKVPSSSDTYSSYDYMKVIEELKQAGFTNIEAKGIYDLSDGFLSSLFVNDVESVSINGRTSFTKGEEFDKNAKIIVTFRDLEINNPNIEFKKYTVRELLDQLDENAMAAKEDHEGEYVVITGKVEKIDASGKYVTIAATDDDWGFETIQCSIETDEQKEQLKKLKKGQTVSIKGKITLVGEILGYSMDIIAFV